MAEPGFMRRWDKWPKNTRKCRRKQRLRASWSRFIRERQRAGKRRRRTIGK